MIGWGFRDTLLDFSAFAALAEVLAAGITAGVTSARAVRVNLLAAGAVLVLGGLCFAGHDRNLLS